MLFDCLIRGAAVVDGSGRPAIRADVAVQGPRIAAVGDLRSVSGIEEIDGRDLILTPGFIDAHAHVDLELLVDPVVKAAISQGVTTEILGQDGLSYAPLSGERLAEQREYLRTLNGAPEVGWDWGSFRTFVKRFEGRVGQNCAFLAPYGAVRLKVAGWAGAPLTQRQLREALRLITNTLDEGAVGVALGLDYWPQAAATDDERTRGRSQRQLRRLPVHPRQQHAVHVPTRLGAC